MTFANIDDFCRWLEEELNATAESCGAYVRTAQESVPEAAGAVHAVLSLAWDAYATVVNQDGRYQVRRDLAAFLAATATVPQATAVERTELYARYLRAAHAGAVREEPLRAKLLLAVLNRLLGEGDGALLGQTFDAAFRELEDESLLPHAVVYVFDDLEDAEPSYEGRQPAYDRATAVLLTPWPPTAPTRADVLALLSAGGSVEGTADRLLTLFAPLAERFPDPERDC